MMFDVLRKAFRSFTDTVAEKTGAGIIITEDHLKTSLEELELLLIQGDVSVDAVGEIIEKVKGALVGKKVASRNKIKHEIMNALVNMLTTRAPELGGKKPFTVLFVGPNGVGKTTTIARIAHLLAKNGKKVVVAAADTFRAGSIEQLEEWAKKTGEFRVVKHNYGADPAAVAYDAVNSAKAKEDDFVLIDTAGRQETNRNLMDQLKKIKRVVSPDLVVFVGEATAGNALHEQIKAFKEELGVDAVVLTKMDLDVKGGGVFTVTVGAGVPLLFVGEGQGENDLKPFDAREIVRRIVD